MSNKITTKFTGIESTHKNSEDNKQTSKRIEFAIPWGTIGFFILSVGIIAFATVKGVRTYNDWKSQWDVVMFAKQNPEIVRIVKVKYDDGIEQVKQELASPKE